MTGSQTDRFPTSGEACRVATPRPPRPDDAGRAGGDGVAGDGTLVVHTAVRNVRQAGPVAVREIGNVRRQQASCDSGYCPALR